MSELFGVEVKRCWKLAGLPIPEELATDPLFVSVLDRVASKAKVKSRASLDTAAKLDALQALASENKLKLDGMESHRWLGKALQQAAKPSAKSPPASCWIQMRVRGLRFDSGMIERNDPYGIRSFVLRLLADAERANNPIAKKHGEKLDDAKFKGSSDDVWEALVVSRKKTGSDNGHPIFEAEISVALPSELATHIAEGKTYPSWAFWYQPRMK